MSCTAAANSNPFEADGIEKVDNHHAKCICLVTVLEQLGQSAAVCFIDVWQRIIRIYGLIHLRVDFLLQMVVKTR